MKVQMNEYPADTLERVDRNIAPLESAPQGLSPRGEALLRSLREQRDVLLRLDSIEARLGIRIERDS